MISSTGIKNGITLGMLRIAPSSIRAASGGTLEGLGLSSTPAGSLVYYFAVLAVVLVVLLPPLSLQLPNRGPQLPVMKHEPY